MKHIETRYELTTPSREEIEFHVREGKRLQGEAVRDTPKFLYRAVIKLFSSLSAIRNKSFEKPGTPLSGHQVHGS